MTDHLLRNLAPISDRAWQAIEEDVQQRLSVYLAARKLVDFEGPRGWSHSATNLGRNETIAAPAPELKAAKRLVVPLVEVRADFTLSRRELDNVEHGARDPELVALDTAANRIAIAENGAVFHGYEAAGIIGIAEAGAHSPITLAADLDQYPAVVARAVDVLRQAGIDGPFGLAIAPDIHTAIIETTEHGGYPLFDHLREILGGAVVWAPGIAGGFVLSQRAGYFAFECGQDIAIGYSGHDAEGVNLYLEESYSFQVLEPDAAIALHVDRVN